MIIPVYGNDGKVVGSQYVPDNPENFSSPEWSAHVAAYERAYARGESWSEEMAATYDAYDQARKRGFK